MNHMKNFSKQQSFGGFKVLSSQKKFEKYRSAVNILQEDNLSFKGGTDAGDVSGATSTSVGKTALITSSLESIECYEAVRCA